MGKMGSRLKFWLAQGERPYDPREYDRYLGILLFMSAFVLTLTLIEIIASSETVESSLDKFASTFPAIVTAFTGVVGAILVASVSSGETYTFSEIRIGERGKKVAVVITFLLYLVATTALVIAVGGAQYHPHGNILLLTATLSAFIANRNYMKLVLGLFAGFSYVLTSSYYFSATVNSYVSVSLFEENKLLMVIAFAVVALSIRASIKIRQDDPRNVILLRMTDSLDAMKNQLSELFGKES